MLNKQLLASLSLFVLFVVTNADEVLPCVEAAPVQDFNILHFSGYWSLYGVSKQDEEMATYSCVRTVIFETAGGDAVPVVSLWKDNRDDSLNMRLRNTKLDKTGQGESADGFSYAIVAYDDRKWAIILGCDASQNKRTVRVLTRAPSPYYNDLQEALNVLNEYNLSLDELRLFDQKACPDDWSSAEKDEIDFYMNMNI